MINNEEKRSLSAEKELLARQLINTNTQLVHKEIEANEWRRSYHELSLSPVRNLADRISPSKISPSKYSSPYKSPFKRY
jgi:hypothetical protein